MTREEERTHSIGIINSGAGQLATIFTPLLVFKVLVFSFIALITNSKKYQAY